MKRHGRLPRRMGEPAAALGPHARGHRLDRHLVLFHGTRLLARHQRAKEQGRVRHGLGGARRRLLSCGEIHRCAAAAAGASAMVQVGRVPDLDDRLRPADRAVLPAREVLPDRSRRDAARPMAGDRDLHHLSARRLGDLRGPVPLASRQQHRGARHAGVRADPARLRALHESIFAARRVPARRRIHRHHHGVQRVHGDHPEPAQNGGAAARRRDSGRALRRDRQAALDPQQLPDAAGAGDDGVAALPVSLRAPARLVGRRADHHLGRADPALHQPRRCR